MVLVHGCEVLAFGYVTATAQDTAYGPCAVLMVKARDRLQDSFTLALVVRHLREITLADGTSIILFSLDPTAYRYYL